MIDIECWISLKLFIISRKATCITGHSLNMISCSGVSQWCCKAASSIGIEGRLYYDCPSPKPDPNPKIPTTMQCSITVRWTAFHLIKCTSRTSCPPPMSSCELELHRTNTGSWHRRYRLDGWTFKLMSVEAQHGCMPCSTFESWMMPALFWGPVGGGHPDLARDICVQGKASPRTTRPDRGTRGPPTVVRTVGNKQIQFLLN